MSDEWPLSEDACPTTTRRVSEMSWIQAMYSLRVDADEERVDWANRAAALEAEVAHLRAALEYVAKCWARYDPGEVNPDEAIAYALKHAENAALKAAEEAMRDDV